MRGDDLIILLTEHAYIAVVAEDLVGQAFDSAYALATQHLNEFSLVALRRLR